MQFDNSLPEKSRLSSYLYSANQKEREAQYRAEGLNKFGMVPTFETVEAKRPDGSTYRRITPSKYNEYGQPIFKDLFSGQEVTIINPKYRL
jgi:hypothetical protein